MLLLPNPDEGQEGFERDVRDPHWTYWCLAGACLVATVLCAFASQHQIAAVAKRQLEHEKTPHLTQADVDRVAEETACIVMQGLAEVNESIGRLDETLREANDGPLVDQPSTGEIADRADDRGGVPQGGARRAPEPAH